MAVPAVEERTWRSVQMRCEKDEENPKASILILFDVLLGCCRRQPRSNFRESTWNLRNSFFSLLSVFFSSTAATALDIHTFVTCPKFICSDLSRNWIESNWNREGHYTKYSAAVLWLMSETQPQALEALYYALFLIIKVIKCKKYNWLLI